MTAAAPPPPVEVDGDLSERVADHQLMIVWSHATMGVVVATVFAVFLALHLTLSLDPLAVRVWLALKIGVAAPRLVQAQIYRHSGHPGGRRWRAWTYGLLALDGAIWGVAGMVVAGEGVVQMAMITASLAGVASVATFGLQVRMLATAAYVAPMIGLLAAGLLWRADEYGVFAGVGMLMYLGLLLSTAYRSEKAMFDTFLLREVNARIAGERQAALELAQRNAEEREAALVLARRQSAAKTQFLATMSHELRTPLHGILGVARLLQLESKDPAVPRLVPIIESSGAHLLSLINDLLDVARIESGHLSLTDRPFNLQAEVERLAEVYAVRTEEKGLGFRHTTNLSPDAWVHGDAARLRQILHNLLGNAVKFTDVGHVTLTVTQGDDDRVDFEVRDSGIGIADGDQARVFDKFSQVETPGRNPLEGTGLGLTIARELARAMGGDIECQSRRGVGSSFRLRVRLARVAAAADAAEAASAAPVRLARAEPARVLLAEDNEVNALVTGAFLGKAGATVEVVDNGRDAVRCCTVSAPRPDLVFMDVRMPTMDGLAATRAIRAQEQRQGLLRLPIVGLTATSSEEDRQRCIAAGMDDCLPKPCRDVDLAAAIERFVERRPEAATPLPALVRLASGR